MKMPFSFQFNRTLHLVSPLKMKAIMKKKKVEKSGPHKSTKKINALYFIFDSPTDVVIEEEKQ